MLMQTRLVVNRRHHLQKGAFRCGAVNVVAAQDDVFQSLFLPLICDVARKFVVAFGTCEMRSRSEDPMLPAFFVGSRDGFELLLNRDLFRGSGVGESQDRVLGLCGNVQKQKDENRETKKGPDRIHGSVSLSQWQRGIISARDRVTDVARVKVVGYFH